MTQIDKNDSKTQGRWTKQEHQKFLAGLQLYGKDWKKIQDYIQTRNGAQIRSHAQKFFLRMKKELNIEASNQQSQINQIPKKQTQLQQNIQRQSQESNNHSYFIGKIIQLSHDKSEFNFWQALIDQKSFEDSNELETDIVNKRKNSFLVCDQNDTEIKNNSKPTKKLKIQ